MVYVGIVIHVEVVVVAIDVDRRFWDLWLADFESGQNWNARRSGLILLDKKLPAKFGGRYMCLANRRCSGEKHDSAAENQGSRE
jgi:hypothetical protein